MKDRYLGDGVYASFDGYHIWLDLRMQDLSRIGLEPAVVKELIKFRNAVYKEAMDAAVAEAEAAVVAADEVLAIAVKGDPE